MEPKHLMESKALNLDVKFQIVVADHLGHQSKKERRKEGRKEMSYLTMHSTHFIYAYMALDIW